VSPRLLSRYLSLTAMEFLAKSGYLDSAVIAEALARPTMRFVPIKTAALMGRSTNRLQRLQ